jgi:hypothetical protein
MVVRCAVTPALLAQQRRLPDTMARSQRTGLVSELRDPVTDLQDRRPALP